MRAAAEYLERVQALPEVLVHLAALVSPSSQTVYDGLPVTADKRSVPARLVPLDDLDEIFVRLWRAERLWRQRLGIAGQLDTAGMVRFDQWGDWDEAAIGPRGVSTDDRWSDLIRIWSTELVQRLERYWPKAEQHAAWPAFVEDLEEWAVRMPLRWPLEERRPVRARARQCREEDCGAWAVWPNPWVDGEAVCDECEAVYRAAEWLKIADAATRVGKSPKTLSTWGRSGRIVIQRIGRGRFVELGAVRAVAAEMLARERAGVAPPA